MQELSEQSKSRIEALLKRAADDISFREELLKNTDAALAKTGLSEEEKNAVKHLRRVSLEELGVDVRPFRAVLRDNGAKMTALAFAIKATKAE